MQQLTNAPSMALVRQSVPSAAFEYEARLLEAVKALSWDDRQRIYLLVLDLGRVSGPFEQRSRSSIEK